MSDAANKARGLEIEGLKVSYGDNTVIEQIDFDMKPGEFITLLGRSGCGKSTMLRYVAGLLDADTSGTLKISGTDLAKAPPHKRNIGFVFQNYALFPHMTVFDNVAFGLRARKVPRADIPKRVRAALDLVQLGKHEDYYPRNLSGGMQQRVALARSLVIDPDVLLLDEPLSALDANLRHDVRMELKALHDRLPDLMVICVSHDREDALTLSHRIALMRAGGMEQVGTAEDLYDRPATRYVAEFLGPVNFLPTDFVQSIGVGNELASPQANTPEAAFCLRPESLHVADKGTASFNAQCVDVDWRGSHVDVYLGVDQGERLQLRSQVSRGTPLPNPGETVTCSFQPQDLHYVAA